MAGYHTIALFQRLTNECTGVNTTFAGIDKARKIARFYLDTRIITYHRAVIIEYDENCNEISREEMQEGNV